MIQPAGVKGRPSQDGLVWHEDCFELKAITTQKIQEKPSPQLPKFALERRACPRKRAIN